MISKSNNIDPMLLFLPLLFLASCSVIGGIFKAGMWVGIILVVGILALIGFLVGRKK